MSAGCDDHLLSMDVTQDDIRRLARRRAISPLLQREAFEPLSSIVRMTCGACSHAGASHAENDDHYLIMQMSRTQETLATSLSPLESPGRFEEHGYAMLVADGGGGMGTGGVASRMVLTTLAHLALHFGKWNLRVDERTGLEITDRLEWYYGYADELLSKTARAIPSLAGMTTTLTAAFSAGADLFLAHVGDARGYLFRDGELQLLTQNQGSAAPSTEELSDLLTDALGARPGSPDVQIGHYHLVHADCLLLCTRGLTDVVDDDGIADVLASRRRIEAQAQALVDLAVSRGCADNVTVVLAQYEVPAKGSA
jgi:PPM family protein phosphatase